MGASYLTDITDCQTRKETSSQTLSDFEVNFNVVLPRTQAPRTWDAAYGMIDASLRKVGFPCGKRARTEVCLRTSAFSPRSANGLS
jgi:hypothetical protein